MDSDIYLDCIELIQIASALFNSVRNIALRWNGLAFCVAWKQFRSPFTAFNLLAIFEILNNYNLQISKQKLKK